MQFILSDQMKPFQLKFGIRSQALVGAFLIYVFGFFGFQRLKME